MNMSDPGGHSFGKTPSDHAETLFQLGVVFANQGRLEGAARLLLEGLSIKPAAAEGYNNLGVVFHKMGRYSNAVRCYNRAMSLRPHYSSAINNLGLTLASLNRHVEAVRCYKDAILIKADYPEALNNLGVALHTLKRDEAALLQFEQALLLSPTYLDAALNLANTLKALSRFEEAIIRFEEVLQLQPLNMVGVQLSLAVSLAGAQRSFEAIELFRHIVELKPDFADAHAGLATTLQEVGQIEQARVHFEKAISIEPRQPSYYRGWALNSTVRCEDAVFAKMRVLADEVLSLNEIEQTHLHFAMGKALSDVGEQEEAFNHFIAGNAIRRRQIIYNEVQEIESLTKITKIFRKNFMEHQEKVSFDSTLPIFILGMPRSGSTLVEQILASHPNVVAGGELRTLERGIAKIVQGLDGSHFPDSILNWGPEEFRGLGSQYLRSLDECAFSQGRKAKVLRVTDKRLDNFRLIGVIKLLFPNAAIVHTYRDPVDTCLSCFSLFFEETEFSYDLRELGRRYHAYEQLMHHWRRVLPPNSFLDVKYEDVVMDTESEARRLLAYCGLEWDPTCLDFYKTERPVRTASVVQVRQPIYRRSIGKRRPSASSLLPLLEGLAGYGT